jgi:hypothetical protein
MDAWMEQEIQKFFGKLFPANTDDLNLKFVFRSKLMINMESSSIYFWF